MTKIRNRRESYASRSSKVAANPCGCLENKKREEYSRAEFRVERDGYFVWARPAK